MSVIGFSAGTRFTFGQFATVVKQKITGNVGGRYLVGTGENATAAIRIQKEETSLIKGRFFSMYRNKRRSLGMPGRWLVVSRRVSGSGEDAFGAEPSASIHVDEGPLQAFTQDRSHLRDG